MDLLCNGWCTDWGFALLLEMLALACYLAKRTQSSWARGEGKQWSKISSSCLSSDRPIISAGTWQSLESLQEIVWKGSKDPKTWANDNRKSIHLVWINANPSYCQHLGWTENHQHEVMSDCSSSYQYPNGRREGLTLECTENVSWADSIELKKTTVGYVRPGLNLRHRSIVDNLSPAKFLIISSGLRSCCVVEHVSFRGLCTDFGTWSRWPHSVNDETDRAATCAPQWCREPS